MERETEREESKALRDFQTRVVCTLQERPPAFIEEASSEENLGLARPRDEYCRPYIYDSVRAYALTLVISSDFSELNIAVTRPYSVLN